jgi:iron complex outermembrane receptor protein
MVWASLAAERVSAQTAPGSTSEPPNGATSEPAKGDQGEPGGTPPPVPTGTPPEVVPTPPTPIGEGGEIIVTAQFRKQNLQKTPVAITAVNGQTLEQRGQYHLAEVSNQAPNTRLTIGNGISGPSLQAHIRGVGQNDFNYAFEPGVGVYVDDVYYATLPGTLLDLLDLDRVEILRGPQGTLAGMNSIGGAIKLYSKVPNGDDTGFVQTTYGDFNRTEVRGAAGFTLIKDKLFGRITGVGNHMDGYVTRWDYACTHRDTTVPSFQITDSCKLGTEGGVGYAATRASLRWIPTDRIDVRVIGDYTNDDSEPVPNTLLYVGTLPPMGPPMTGVPNAPMSMMPSPNTMIGGVPLGNMTGSPFISYSPFGNYAQDTFVRSPYINYSTYVDPSPADGSPPYSQPPVNRLSHGGGSADATFDLSDDFSLRSITAYRYYKGDWSIANGTPVNDYLLHNFVWHRQFTEELRLNGHLLRDAINLTLGGFYLDEYSHYGGRIGLRTAQFIESDNIPASSAAGFGNVEWRVVPQLSLIGGGRYTRQDKEFDYGRGLVAGANPNNPVLKLNGVAAKFGRDHGDFRGAVQYQVIPELMAYGQVSSGFKGGGYNPRPFSQAQALPHDPENLIAYELGIKTDLLNKRVRINLAGFFNQYNDIVVTATQCPPYAMPIAPCFLPLNAGTANIVGGELETLITPVTGLGINGSLSYLNFKYQSISPIGASSGITTDMTAPYAPAWEGSLGAQYEAVIRSAGSITPRLDFSYQDFFYTTPTNTSFSRVDAHALLNGRLWWTSTDKLWLAALEVTNITGLVYYYNIRDDRGSSYTVQGQPAPPRMWAVTLRRNFL